MLETIRAHAAENSTSPANGKTTRRFTRHFADLAEEHEPLLRSHEQEESLRLFHTEYDNLVHALRTAIDDDDATTAARILATLHWYWIMVRYEPRGEAFVAKVPSSAKRCPRTPEPRSPRSTGRRWPADHAPTG